MRTRALAALTLRLEGSPGVDHRRRVGSGNPFSRLQLAPYGRVSLDHFQSCEVGLVEPRDLTWRSCNHLSDCRAGKTELGREPGEVNRVSQRAAILGAITVAHRMDAD